MGALEITPGGTERQPTQGMNSHSAGNLERLISLTALWEETHVTLGGQVNLLHRAKAHFEPEALEVWYQHAALYYCMSKNSLKWRVSIITPMTMPEEYSGRIPSMQ